MPENRKNSSVKGRLPFFGQLRGRVCDLIEIMKREIMKVILGFVVLLAVINLGLYWCNKGNLSFPLWFIGLLFDSDFWFAMFTESVIVFVTFIVAIKFIEGEDKKNRKIVYKSAYEDACHIYEEIHKFIYHIMAGNINSDMRKFYKDTLEFCESITDKKVDQIIKSFVEDADTGGIIVNRKNFDSEIDDLYSDIENYLQRFGAFLTSDATERKGSYIYEHMNDLRRSFRKLSRSVDLKDSNEFRVVTSDVVTHIRKVVADIEKYDQLLSAFEHREEAKEAETKSKKTETQEFRKIKFLIHELEKDKHISDIHQDACILTLASLFDVFGEFMSDKNNDFQNFKVVEFDFWCEYWDFRHRCLERARIKCGKNNLEYGISGSSQSDPDGLKNTPNQDHQDCIADLETVLKTLNAWNNDKGAIEVFERYCK